MESKNGREEEELKVTTTFFALLSFFPDSSQADIIAPQKLGSAAHSFFNFSLCKWNIFAF